MFAESLNFLFKMGHLKGWGHAGTVSNLRSLFFNMKTSGDPQKTEGKKKKHSSGKKKKRKE